MKILYIGHYKEGTGWSKAATDLILSMQTSGLDVVCRNIKLTGSKPTVDKRLLMLEQKPLKDIDICIQHVLPHHLVGTEKFKKNIAYFVGESSTIKYTNWFLYLLQMDEVWVPNKTIRNVCIQDGLDEKKIKVIPHAFDMSQYNKSGDQINFGPHNHKFKFYYICDLNDRKNLKSIIRCFNSEFHNYEPVTLVLKVKKFGNSPEQLKSYITKMCNEIKKELRIYADISQYNQELIISEDLQEREMAALHNSCDCFVGASHGEGWSIPAFDAMCYGNTPICSKDGGPREFIDENDLSTGFLVNGVYSICNHSDAAFPDIFTGREEWFTPSESEIKRMMRYYYENRDKIDRDAGLKQASKFSYESVGQIIKDALND
jgi:glycosyltransferase involved in cell wall biosynthesis